MKGAVMALGTPNPRQREFLACRKKYIAFGGARGGGKSWAVRCKAKLLALRYPGIRLLLVRRSLPELESNHLTFLRQELAEVAEYRAGEHRFVFSNGSTLQFGYCGRDADLDRYQGAEYDVIFLDEATQLKEQWMRQIAACLRGVNDLPKRIYYTCNPGGPGHGYIKRLFIDRRYEPGEEPEDYAFIPARVTDNTVLLERQPEYIRQLEALPPKLRRAWLEGKWDVFAGQVFQEFTDDPAHYDDRRWTHVIRPFDVPREWNVYRSYVLIGGKRVKVASNTASKLVLEEAVTAADKAVIYPGEGGKDGCAVYGCLFLGKGAYGVVDLSEGTEVIVKPRGSSGTADPLDQRSSVGWKGVHAAAILYDEYMVRVECGSSYSGEDKAN